MNTAVPIIAECQSVIARYLPPDGIRGDEALRDLIKILEGPEAVALTMQPVPPPPSNTLLGELRQKALSLCYLIEESGASPELTAISLKASELHQSINAAMGAETDGASQAPKPTIGRIVHLTLTERLASEINRDPAIGGNAANEGETYPLMITRVWPEETYLDGMTINGQLLLDGPNNKWMTSVHYGTAPGSWHWFNH